jgi:hypothetical protein
MPRLPDGTTNDVVWPVVSFSAESRVTVRVPPEATNRTFSICPSTGLVGAARVVSPVQVTMR